MKKQKVTAIGEILWDVYPDKKRLGGAPFNFIYHVWKLSGSAHFLSSVGNDGYGMEILDYLRRQGFPAEYVYIDKEHPTGTVQVKIRDDKTPVFKISAECCYDFLRLDDNTRRVIEEETEILYFGTLAQRSAVSRNTMKSLMGKNIKYFCDLNLRHDFFSKDMIEDALNTSNVIKINLDELDKLRKYFGLPEDMTDAAGELRSKFRIDLVAVTMGEDGALLSDAGAPDIYKPEDLNVIDTVGAGDAFAAVLCLGYLNRLELNKINKLANDFASAICMMNGALPGNDIIYNKFKREFENDS